MVILAGLVELPIVHAGIAKQKSVKLEDVPSLVIDDFYLYGVSERLSFIERGFSEIIQLSLLPHKNVNVVSRSKLWQTLRSMNEVPRHEWGPRRIFKDDVLGHPDIKADYILKGKIYDIGRALQLNAVLINLASKEQYKISPMVFNEEHIFDSTKMLADAVSEHLNQAVKTAGIEAINKRPNVFICLSKPRKSTDNFAALIATDLSIFLEERLQQEFEITADVDENNPGCVKNAKNSPQWKSDRRAAIIQAVIYVKPSGKSRLIEFSPRIILNNPSVTVETIEFSLDREKYDLIQDGFLKVATEYIEKTMSDDGIAQLVRYSRLDSRSKADPSDSADLVQGKILFESGDEVDAVKYFRRVLKNNPGDPQANYYMGRVLSNNNYSFDAIPYYLTAIRNDRDFVDAYERLAEAYTRNQNYIEAKQLYEEVLKKDRNNINATRYLGYHYMGANELEKAAYYFRRTLKSKKDDMESILSLGSISVRKRNYNDAASWYRKALMLDDNNERALSSLADVYRRLAIKARAEGDIRSAIENRTHEIDLLRNKNSAQAVEARLFRAQLNLKLAQQEDLELSPTISELSALASVYRNNPTDKRLQLADVDLILANLIEGEYENANKLSLKSLSTHYDDLETRVFIRLLNITSNTMMNIDTRRQTDLLEEDLAVLQRQRYRNIGEPLSQRYEMISELTSRSRAISKNQREYMQKLTSMARGE